MTREVLEVLGPSTGGIRRHVAALVAQLPDLGWRPTVAGPDGVMDGLVDAAESVAIASSFASMARRPVRLVACVRDLRRLARSASVVHAHGLKAGLVVWCARTSAPFVITVHNVVLDDVAGRGAPIIRRVERAVVRRADRVICGSAEIAEHLRGIVEPGRLRTITPAAPDPEPLRSRREVRGGLGLHDDDPLVVVVARLHPQKHLTMLVRAFATIADDHPRAQVVVVGEGPEHEALQRLIDRLELGGRVRLVGSRPNPADEMAAADIVALSSIWEGVPLVAAEAMQLGRPLVMTAVGTIGAQLLVDGVGGTAVAVDDEAGFAAALDHYLRHRDEAERAGVAGRTVGERYRAGHLVAEVATVYEEVAG